MTLIQHRGLEIDIRWERGAPGTYWEPADPDELCIDSITIIDRYSVARLFHELGIDPRLAYSFNQLTNSGLQSRIYDWAYNDNFISDHTRIS